MSRILLLSLAVLGTRLLTLPRFPESPDGILFVRGVRSYSVAEMRPHWPGYPVYVWLGKLVNLAAPDPVAALHVLSAVSSALSTSLIMLLAGTWRRATGGSKDDAERAGLAAGIFWALTPLSWLVGTEILSEPPALLVALGVLYLSSRLLAEIGSPSPVLLVAAVAAGVLPGLRLPYVVLLAPLAYACWRLRKQRLSWHGRSVSLLIPPLVVVSLVVGLWLGWQWAVDGGRFLEAGRSRLDDHLGRWSGRVLAHGRWWERPVDLTRTAVIYGVGGWWPGVPAVRLLATLGFGGMLVAGARRLAHPVEVNGTIPGPQRRAEANSLRSVLALLWTLPYALLVLLANDPSVARYGLPLVAMACIVAGMGLPAKPRSAGLLLGAVALSLAVVSVPLAVEHATSPPLGVKLARYLNEALEPAQAAVLISDDVPALRLFVEEGASAFLCLPTRRENLTHTAAALGARGLTAYATAPPPDAPEDWTPIAWFRRGRFLESRGPLEMFLYRHDPPRR